MGEFSDKTVRLAKDSLTGWRDAELDNFFSEFGLSSVYRRRKEGWGRLARINDVFASVEWNQPKRDAIIREVISELWRGFEQLDDPDTAFNQGYGELTNSLRQDGLHVANGKVVPLVQEAERLKEVAREVESKKLEKFAEGVLEHIAKVIGNWKTGSEISELLTVAGYSGRSQVVGTKWRFLYDIFKDLNVKPDGQYHVAKIVQTFCDATRWIGREEDRKQVMNSFNEALRYANLQLNEDGKLVLTETRITHKVGKREGLEPGPTTPMLLNPIFRTRDMAVEKGLCFVLMPFRPSFDRLYQDTIKPAIEASGFRSLRADDLFSPTPILEDIWVHICKSRVVIADVTGRNPNVFYEIGIAHTVGRPVIIITQDKNDIPFDIAQFRYFLYSDDSLGWETLSRSIAHALRSLTVATDSPLGDAQNSKQ